MLVPAIFLLLAASPPADAAIPIEAADLALAYLLNDGGDARGYVYCIKIAGNDAPAETLNKLRRPDRIVVVGSECKWVPDRHSKGSYHISSRKPAYIVEVTHPRWTSATSLLLDVEAMHQDLWGAGCTLKLEFVDGHWKVEGEEHGWVA